MEKTHFIGIDVSKQKIDVYVYGTNAYRQFNNDPKGYEAMTLWIKKVTCLKAVSEVMICFEHTGIYTLLLSFYLEENGIPFSVSSALQIKRSMGIARGKNDKVDAKRIAEYAFRYRDLLQQTKLPSRSVIKLQPLLTARDRLTRQRAGFIASLKEQQKFLLGDDHLMLFEVYNNMILKLGEEIKKMEKSIKEIIRGDEELKRNFDLITAIKGVGLIIAANIIVLTHNFTRFNNWRKFACYAGIAPFDFQSGTSVQGKARVNEIAHKGMKKLLHIAAVHAALTDKEMGAYYKRRTEAGYNKMSTLNCIRNKVLARIFAVVNRGTPYIEMMKHIA